MGNRSGRDEMKATRLGMVAVPVRVTFGATGAPTVADDIGDAVNTLTRTAAGRYTLTFREGYDSLRGYCCAMDYQGTATGGTWETFTGYVAATGVVVLSHTVADAEADPSDGDQADFVFFMKSSSVG